MSNKKVFFASDFHLGLPTEKKPRAREDLIISWLDDIKADAEEIFLLGDIFDFWYEYKRVAPKGFIRFLGKIAEITDSGIPVHFFVGNHDVWMFDYLPQEIGVQIHRGSLIREIKGKKFFIAHGDGLIQGDYGYKLLKSAYHSKTLQWLFSRIHPNFSLWLGHSWSKSSRKSKGNQYIFKGDNEPIVEFANRQQPINAIDFFVFGHWHVPVIHPLNNGANLVILGDWIENNTFAQWDGKTCSIIRYEPSGSTAVAQI